MRFISFLRDGSPRVGMLVGGTVIDLNQADPEIPPDMLSFIAAGPFALEGASAVLARWSKARCPASALWALADVQRLAPIPNPPKIVAVGVNYLDHCRETGTERPSSPILFAKFPTAVIGPDEAIEWDPTFTARVDYEAELAVVIGQMARRVPRGRALDVVFGYTCANDVTARDLQMGDRQWVRGKSLDTFCPLGPVLVTRDEVLDPGKLGIQCRVNGAILQESNTSGMIFDIPTLIEFISAGITLLPGDVILTGTPHGVGNYRRPPVFLRDGDQVAVKIDLIGTLLNHCREVAVATKVAGGHGQ